MGLMPIAIIGFKFDIDLFINFKNISTGKLETTTAYIIYIIGLFMVAMLRVAGDEDSCMLNGLSMVVTCHVSTDKFKFVQ